MMNDQRISKAKIAIVIPSAGGEDALYNCLRSISKHTIVDMDICVVSQGELGAYDYLKGIEDSGEYDYIHVHYNDVNEPGSRGYNKGINLAYNKVPDFDYLLFLDDDVVIYKQGWLNNLALYLDDHDEVGIVGYQLCSLGKPNENDSVLEFMSCCMLCRRTMMDKIGLMDETLLWHRNDSDYCLRAWQANYRVCVINANDYKDVSNDYMRHIHQVGTKRLANEAELREQTYKIFDKKWAGVNIKIW